MIFIGIDIGKKGGVGFYDTETEKWECFPTSGSALNKKLQEVSKQQTFCVIERVNSSPQMGVVSAFAFGEQKGFIKGQLTALGIGFHEVGPETWMAALGCLTGGDKNISKNKAIELFQDTGLIKRVTHQNADALLITEYARLIWLSL